MFRPYFDEENCKMVAPTREQILTEAYNEGWNIAYYGDKYFSTVTIDLNDRAVHQNWKIGIKAGEESRSADLRLGISR